MYYNAHDYDAHVVIKNIKYTKHKQATNNNSMNKRVNCKAQINAYHQNTVKALYAH